MKPKPGGKADMEGMKKIIKKQAKIVVCLPAQIGLMCEEDRDPTVQPHQGYSEAYHCLQQAAAPEGRHVKYTGDLGIGVRKDKCYGGGNILNDFKHLKIMGGLGSLQLGFLDIGRRKKKGVSRYQEINNLKEGI